MPFGCFVIRYAGTRDQISDLQLWQSFLVCVGQGISLNPIPFRFATDISRTNAREHGVGGFSLRIGRDWRGRFRFTFAYVSPSTVSRSWHAP